MQGPQLSQPRQDSDTVLELTCLCDEISTHCQPRVPLPALTAADQRVLRTLFARCDGVIEAARDTQAALAPYLARRAA